MPIKNLYSTLSFKKEFEVKEIFVKDGNLFVVPKTMKKAEQTVNEIINIAKNVNAKHVNVDLSSFNMFDALKVATLTSAYGLTKSLTNKYEVVVADEITRNQIQLLSLSNLEVSVKRHIDRVFQPARELLSVDI